MWEIYDLVSVNTTYVRKDRWQFRYVITKVNSNITCVYRFKSHDLERKAKYQSTSAQKLLTSGKGRKLKPIYTCDTADECFDVIQTLRLLGG